jgi:signal transduction histidine kinase
MVGMTAPETLPLRRFVAIDAVAVSFFMSVIAAIYLLIEPSPWLLAIEASLALVGLSLFLAGRATNHGQPRVAVALITGANWAVTLIVGAIAPVALYITPLIVVMPVVLSVPYVSRRTFGRLAAAAVVLVVALCVLGRVPPPLTSLEPRVPPRLLDVLVVLAVPFVVGALACAAWDIHRQMSRQADMVMAARARLLSAVDDARRALERNLHDGTQQRLVAIAVQLRVAQRLVERDQPRALEVLEELIADAHAAVEELRDLSHGIYPPDLRQHGLEHALRAVARRSPHTVLVARGVARYPPAVEAAVYFSCVEAVQNALKHASATRITIGLTHASGIAFAVTDDGIGFAAAVAPGSGLDNIGARILAQGGTVEIASRVGHGTTIMGVIPTRSSPGVTIDPAVGGGSDIAVFPHGIYRVSGTTPRS